MCFEPVLILCVCIIFSTTLSHFISVLVHSNPLKSIAWLHILVIVFSDRVTCIFSALLISCIKLNAFVWIGSEQDEKLHRLKADQFIPKALILHVHSNVKTLYFTWFSKFLETEHACFKYRSRFSPSTLCTYQYILLFSKAFNCQFFCWIVQSIEIL